MCLSCIHDIINQHLLCFKGIMSKATELEAYRSKNFAKIFIPSSELVKKTCLFNLLWYVYKVTLTSI